MFSKIPKWEHDSSAVKVVSNYFMKFLLEKAKWGENIRNWNELHFISSRIIHGPQILLIQIVCGDSTKKLTVFWDLKMII